MSRVLHASNVDIQPESNSIIVEENSKKNRTSSWYHGSFHLLCGNVGLGVLSLPKTLQDLGWVLGLSWFIILSALSGYSYYCVMKCCYSKVSNSRLMTYVDIAKETFNSKWIPLIRLMLALFQFGCMVAMSIAGADNLYQIYQTYNTDYQNGINEKYFKVFVIIPQIFLCFIKKLDQFRIVSFLGFLCTILYLSIAVYLCFTMKIENVGNPNDDIWPKVSKEKTVFHIITSLLTTAGAVIFAYTVACLTPNVLYTLKENISRDNGEPGSYESTKAIKFFMLINVVIYLFVMILGKVTFGDQLEPELLIAIAKHAESNTEKNLITISQICIVFHVIVAFQIFAFALFDTILEFYYSRFKKKIANSDLSNTDISWFKVLIGRLVIVALALGTTIGLPYYADIVGLISAIFGIPICYAIPIAMYYTRLRRDYKFSTFRKITYYFLEIFCYALAVLITISSVNSLIQDLSS